VRGRVLSQRWRLVDELGRGGMGAVWRAEHLELGTPAAVKLIDPSIASSDAAVARFKREAQAAATLRSTHVVQILDYGVDQNTPFIAMELLDGESLAERIVRLGRLSPEMTSTIMTHTARAVGRGHEAGVVHRDLKPDNIYVVTEDDQEICKVLDFGIAKHTADGFGSTNTPQTQTGAMLGTPFYMSPEQASGKKQVDHRTDIWAMAVIAFECLVGRRPFEGQTLGALLLAICTEDPPIPSQCGAVPAGFDQWFARGVARDPDQRFASAREAALALQTLCTPDPSRDALASAPDAAAQVTASGAHFWGAPGPASTTGAATHAVTAPTPGAGVPPTGPGWVGDSAVVHSTAEQMPPSALSVAGLPRRSGAALLLSAVAALAVLGAGAAALLWLRSGEDPASGAVPSSEAVTPVASTMAAPAADLGEEKPAAEASAEPAAKKAPAPEASADRTPNPPPSPAVRHGAPVKPTKPDPQPAAAPIAASPAPQPAPTAPPPAPPPQPPPRSAKDRLEDGFGF